MPTIWGASIIDRARNVAQVLAAGAETIPMDSKTLQLGRLTTDPTAAWLAEGGTRAASDPVFDSVVLTAKTLSCLTVASLEFLQDAVNRAEEFQMFATDTRNDSRIRLNHFEERPQLARMVRPHLQNSRAMHLFQLQQRQRHAHFIIKTRGAGQCFEFLAQD